MARFLALVLTRNNPDGFCQLLLSFARQRPLHDIRLVALNDRSAVSYQRANLLLQANAAWATMIATSERHGLARENELWRRLLVEARRAQPRPDFALWLSDAMTICDNLCELVARYWRMIDDPAALALSLTISAAGAPSASAPRSYLIRTAELGDAFALPGAALAALPTSLGGPQEVGRWLQANHYATYAAHESLVRGPSGAARISPVLNAPAAPAPSRAAAPPNRNATPPRPDADPPRTGLDRTVPIQVVSPPWTPAPWLKRPRVGMILRADEGGLANHSIDFYQYLRPAKSLVVRVGAMPCHPDRFPDAAVTDGLPNETTLRRFLEGLDVVLTFETPYNWRLFDLARTMGVRTILMVNYEYLDDPLPTQPDVLWMPTPWHLADVRKLGIPTIHVPVPIDRVRYRFVLRRQARTFVAVLGNYRDPEHDRSGAQTILQAIPLVKNRNVRFILRSRHPLPRLDDPRVVVDDTPKANPWENWQEGDVLLHPRRYAGLSLPMQEALSCGMPVLMTDMEPQRRLLPRHWMIAPDKIQPHKIRRVIELATVNPSTLAAKIDEWAWRDLTDDSEVADAIATSLAWDVLRPDFEALFAAPPVELDRRSHFSLAWPRAERPQRIAYLGNFRHPHCTEVHVAGSLEDMGHSVTRLQEDNGFDPDKLLARIADADLFFWTHTQGWNPLTDAEWRQVFRELKPRGVPTASLHLDLYLGISRAPQVTRDRPFWATDHVFTADGGHDEVFRSRGINHHFLPPGIYDREAFLGTPRAELADDLVFVGSYPYPHSEWTYRDRMIEALRARYGPRLQIWGGFVNRPIRNERLNDLYASAKIVIGDSLYSPHYWSDRYTETMGRGGFLIAPVVDGIELYYTPGEHFVGYDYQRGGLADFEGLCQLVDYYLEHDAARERIRRAGFEHVRRRHTFQHRLREMLAIIGRRQS